jgi:hypothetical protein
MVASLQHELIPGIKFLVNGSHQAGTSRLISLGKSQGCRFR